MLCIASVCIANVILRRVGGEEVADDHVRDVPLISADGKRKTAVDERRLGVVWILEDARGASCACSRRDWSGCCAWWLLFLSDGCDLPGRGG